MNLRMARPTDSSDSLDRTPIEVAFIALVMVACPRNQMMAGQRLFAAADGAQLFR